MAKQEIEQIIEELGNRIQTIEAYPENRRPYVDLYETILKALPFLSDKKEKNGILGQNIVGKLRADYMIDYTSKLGITQAAVSDTRKIAENQLIRRYSTGRVLGIIALYSAIWEIDVNSKSERIIKENKFHKK